MIDWKESQERRIEEMEESEIEDWWGEEGDWRETAIGWEEIKEGDDDEDETVNPEKIEKSINGLIR